MKKENTNCENKHSHKVKITLNDKKVTIESGSYKICDLKTALSVPNDYILEIVKDGQFSPLENNDELIICGHEIFVSHVKCGGSS